MIDESAMGCDGPEIDVVMDYPEQCLPSFNSFTSPVYDQPAYDQHEGFMIRKDETMADAGSTDREIEPFAHMRRSSTEQPVRIDVVDQPLSSIRENADITVGAYDDKGIRRSQEDEFVHVTLAPSSAPTPPGSWCSPVESDVQCCIGVVCDGHGGNGASKFASANISEALRNRFSDFSWMDDGSADDLTVPHALVDAIIDADLHLYRRHKASNEANFRRQGTTVTLQFIAGMRGYVSWLGDSRAVLCERGRAVRLTRDHKVDDHEECQRQQRAREEKTVILRTYSQSASLCSEGGSSHGITTALGSSAGSAGGSLCMQSPVHATNGQPASPPAGLEAVLSPVSINEVPQASAGTSSLEVTRALGDFGYKEGIEQNLPMLVTNRADVVQFDVTSGTMFTVIASDGLWDALDDQAVVSFVLDFLRTTPFDEQPPMSNDVTPHHDRHTSFDNYVSNICNKLIIHAKTHPGYNGDNITVMITLLQSMSSLTESFKSSSAPDHSTTSPPLPVTPRQSYP